MEHIDVEHERHTQEDMFHESQACPDTQEETGSDPDNLYISYAQAIVAQKCRVLQKKETIKMLVEQLQKLDKKIETAKKESDDLKKETNEITRQQDLKALSLSGTKESRTSLEGVNANLTVQVSLAGKKLNESKERHRAQLQKANDLWLKYEEEYESWPLAQKRREVKLEIQKMGIKLRQIKLDNEDLKLKLKLKADIADKRRQVSVIKIAEAYVMRETLLAECATLEKNIRELKMHSKELENSQQLSSKENLLKPESNPAVRQGSQKATNTPVLQLTMPQIMTSPPRDKPLSRPENTGLFSWKNFFTNSTLLNYRRTNQNNQVDTPQSSNKSASNTISNTTASQLTAKSPQKREASLQNKVLIEKHVPLKRVKFDDSQNVQTHLEGDAVMKMPDKKNNQLIPKNIVTTYTGGRTDKLNLDSTSKRKLINTNHTNVTKRIMSMVSFSKKPEIRTATSYEQRNTMIENLKVKVPIIPENTNTLEDSTTSDEADMGTMSQPSHEQRSANLDTDLFEGSNTKIHPDASAISMISTPPDVIPGENISQLEESGSGSYLTTSTDADFTSPIELDNAAKAHYQQLAAESPEYVFSKGLDFQKQTRFLQKGTDMRSKYFTKPQPQPADDQEPAYAPYSPPLHLGLSNDMSPPYPGVGGSSPSESQLFNQPDESSKDKSSEEEFGFTFSSTQRKKSSFFSLF